MVKNNIAIYALLLPRLTALWGLRAGAERADRGNAGRRILYGLR